MILGVLSTARDLGRLHEIAGVLMRYGLGDAVQRLGLARLLERAGKVLHWKAAHDLERAPEVRVREALEELGPTFVKLGQLLAGRSDLLHPSWTKELSRLHERATPVPYEKLAAQLAEDLGRAPDEAFQDFDPEPLAAASIAQVHRATLVDGTSVVLKIRRPGIRDSVEADLRLLARLAERAEERLPELRRYRPRSLVRQFSRSLRDELDLRLEAKNARRLRENLNDDAGIVVPRIHTAWTRERLCVMDFLPGVSLGAWVDSGRPGDVDPAQVAARGADTVLRMVFRDGCFHADPHPGNVLLLEDGRLGLLDFGMVGTLTEARRLELLRLLLAVGSCDVETTVEILLEWSDDEIDVDLLRHDCTAFIDRYHGLSLTQLDVGELLGDLTALLRENDLFLPNDIALLLKVFVTLESLGRTLDPDFVMAQRIEPFARAAWREQTSPGAIVRRGAKEVGSLLAAVPRDLRRILYRARRGKLQVAVDLQRLDRFGLKLERSANRVTVGLVTSALIVGTAISLTVDVGPRFAGLPLFGLLGFGSSLVAGVWLLWSILRSGRSE